ncbi:glutathione S-transferase [Aliiroseovarius crassostreae]|uniref:glutathione S-transferase n=1 Tax=Aliiroseovarius crassostreae TaxID=154981 RepID=UPI002203A905|nr:glutathione S-transferase [Aliiroseovarius crassostreae]UWP98233.1 glutathione S-transferase [Aliiroseovarius crassostreae]
MRPVLYSFRRCPYAIRARLAIASAGTQVELREILLREKPPAFLAKSPSATVPCLVTEDGVIDESLDIMKWALDQSDPEGLLQMPQEGHALIARFDGPFKKALDHTKYAVRHPDRDPEAERTRAMEIIGELTESLEKNTWLFGATPSLADFAILPFLRQFAMIDKPRFDREADASTREWLDSFINSQRLLNVMTKYTLWKEGDPVLLFPSISN